MALTVEEFRDLLRILEARPEWRGELLLGTATSLPPRIRRGAVTLFSYSFTIGPYPIPVETVVAVLVHRSTSR